MKSNRTMSTPGKIRRALLSVSDKQGLEDLARDLSGFGVELLATGGTAARLKQAGIGFRPIENYTGNPEAFGGRMKTISFKLESAILFDRLDECHQKEAAELGIEPIDLVVCNFYPFEAAAARGAGEKELVEEIDIGGPTMVRAAAKNHRSVLVLTDPRDYARVVEEMRNHDGSVSEATRREMAIHAFEKVYRYDQAIYETFVKQPLRYGENPHQSACFVPDLSDAAMSWELVRKSETQLSYNNFLDADAALNAVRDARALAKKLSKEGQSACVVVKHGNPCGLAVAPTPEQALARAWEGDPVSAFGSVIALAGPFTMECARFFSDKFVEVILAEDFPADALAALEKKSRLRLLRICPEVWEHPNRGAGKARRVRIEGGELVQDADTGIVAETRVVTKAAFPEKLLPLADFGMVAAKWIKSNAIAIVRELPGEVFQLVGMGAGQPNRVDSIRRLAVPRTHDVLKKESLSDCVLVSDAFFPFTDNVEEAHAAGIRYVVQPGGSKRDEEVISACDRLGIAMVMTGKRHFRH